MKIVIAMDSFKDSLSSIEAGTAVCSGILRVYPDAKIKVLPLADGGEGTVEALTLGMGGELQSIEVTGPLNEQKVTAQYGILRNKKTAIIEMAAAAGLTLLPSEKRNPLYTTTYGVGEILRDAINKGCRHFIIGIGGSATNDGGLGMLQALGWQMLDSVGEAVPHNAIGLERLAVIDDSTVLPALKECTFRIACDVTNPLCGPEGCSAVFGPQKGATPEIVAAMDQSIRRFAELAETAQKKHGIKRPGAGAAGGLGFAFHTFLDGELVPGSQLCLEAIGVRDALKDADLLITGEGRMDRQTAMGKGPSGIATLAHQLSPGIRTVAVCGCALPDAEAVNEHGIDAYFPILHLPMRVEEAMEEKTARQNLHQTVTQLIRLLRE